MFNKWTIDGSDLPTKANATPLTYKTTDYKANIDFNVLPKVTFATTSETGAIEDNIKIQYKAPTATDYVDCPEYMYFADGDKAWKDGDTLYIGSNYPATDTAYAFRAYSDGHYQALNI